MPARDSSARSCRGAVILVVEPHAGVKDEIRRQLEGAFPGASIVDAANGESAVAACRQFQPALTVMDVILPGISGIKTIEALKAVRAGMPVIVYSIHGESAFRQRAQEAGAVAYIEKTSPFAGIIAAARSALADQP